MWAEVATPLLLTLFPARCGACDVGLPSRPPTHLCDSCLHSLQANVGPRCPRCDQGGDAALCVHCRGRPHTFSRLRAPWQYGGALAELMVAIKFRGREDLVPALANLIVMDGGAEALGRAATSLVPVPLGPRRRRSRGYNPSTMLAHLLAKRWQRPVVHALRRRDTPPQSTLKLAQRRLNVRQAFTPRTTVFGTVLLVDDVVTSGETAHDASRALLAAGATQVMVVAVARAIA